MNPVPDCGRPANDAPPYLLQHLLSASTDELKGAIAHAAGLLMAATSAHETAEVLSNVRGALIARAVRESVSYPAHHVPVGRAAIEEALSTVERETGVAAHEVMGRSRKRRVARARQYAFWILRQRIFADGRPRHAFKDIARAFGRDHSTVIWAVQRCEERLRQGAAA